MRNLPLVFSVALLLGGAALAQNCGITTILNGTSGTRGHMFDITNISAGTVTVLGFEQSFFGAAPATAAVEIFTVTSGGPFQPVQSTASAWTLMGSNPGVTCNPQGTLTPIPITVGVTIAPGTTRGFYVTCTNATTTQGVNTPQPVATQGNVFVQDAAIAVRIGAGKLYPFSVTYNGRMWNGRVLYSTGAASYETNDPASSLDIDGVQGNQCAATRITPCVFRTLTANLASTGVGLGWEAVLGFVPLVPAGAGALLTANGQIVNINLLGAPFLFLFGGAAPALQPFPGSFSTTFSSGGAPGTLCLQMLNVAPGHPDGFALSQATQIDIQPAATVVGPTFDDSNLLVTFSASPVCGPPSVPFYGTTYTQFQVISNGRIMFGTNNNTAAPAINGALTNAPSIGSWCDLDPSLGGNITTTSPGLGLVRVSWNNVPYFTLPALTTNWSITIDAISGSIVIDGLLGFPVFPVGTATSNQAMLGISAGSLGATDPGQTSFVPGGPYPGPTGLGMIYQFGQAGTLAPGINTLTFVPNFAGNYDWSG